MDKVKKWFFCLSFTFLPCLLSLIISLPANALTLTLGVSPTGVEYANPVVQCSGPDYDDPFTDATIGNKTYCQIDPPSTVGDGFELRGIRTKNTYAVEEGKLYTIYLEVRNNSGTIGNSKPMLWTVQPFPSDYFALVGMSTEYTQVGLTHSDSTISADYDEWYSDMYAITVKALKSGTTRFQLGNTTQILVTSRIVSAQYSPTYKYQVRMNRIVEYDSDSTVEDALEHESEREKQEIQDASDDSEEAADDSQDDVDSATSSLLSVLSSFVGVITSASPSNCNIDGTIFPHLNLGSLNLCENAPPPAITTLGSLILIAFVIPLVYNTIKMIINLFSEFQR